MHAAGTGSCLALHLFNDLLGQAGRPSPWTWGGVATVELFRKTMGSHRHSHRLLNSGLPWCLRQRTKSLSSMGITHKQLAKPLISLLHKMDNCGVAPLTHELTHVLTTACAYHRSQIRSLFATKAFSETPSPVFRSAMDERVLTPGWETGVNNLLETI
jgi:hypothetical protein